MKRAILLTITIIVSLVAVTGTLAYFTDQVQADGVIASGNLSIYQHEYERIKDANGIYTGQLQPYTQGQMLFPGSDVDKIVQIENAGKNTAYVRTFVAVPAYYTASGTSTSWISLLRNEAATNWQWSEAPIPNVRIDGATYDVYYATNTAPLAPGETTEASMLGFHVSEQVDYDGHQYTITLESGEVVPLVKGQEFTMLITSEASQAIVFEDAFEALNVSYGGEPAIDRHPWQAMVIAENDAALAEALKSAAYDSHISLKDGNYTLPAELPDGIRLTGMGLDVKVTLADTLYAYDVEFDHMIITNQMVFTGNGSFQDITFENGWKVTQPDGDVQFDGCRYDSGVVDSGAYTVTQTNCTTLDGTPVIP